MKSFIKFIPAVLTAVVLSVPAIAQDKSSNGTKTEKAATTDQKKTVATDQQKKDMKTATPWKEQNDFHTVMAATFHPMEDGDFKPVRARANELNAKAIAWQKSTPPKEFDNPKIKDTLASLQKATSELAEIVKSGAGDDVIRQKISEVHDIFHTIVGLCRHEG